MNDKAPKGAVSADRQLPASAKCSTYVNNGKNTADKLWSESGHSGCGVCERGGQ